MREFFRGWRRKVGVVTLMMACVFAAGWVRSLTSTDGFQWNLKAFGFGAMSTHNSVAVIFGILDEPFGWSLPEFMSGRFSTIDEQFKGLDWRWGFAGIRFGRDPTPATSAFVCVAAYSWVVLPLTLTSAVLLLKKPQQSTPMKTTIPISGEGRGA